MSEGRDTILASIRRSLGRDSLPAEDTAKLDDRLVGGRPHIIPHRVEDAAAWPELFRAKAEAIAATVDEIDGVNELPAAVERFLGRRNEPSSVVASPDPIFQALPWSDASTLDVRFGAPGGKDEITLTRAFAGIAETGTVMVATGPEHAATASFLPEANIVVLFRSRLVGAMEHAWARFREERGPGMPRAVHMVTGPSRTADIAQQLELGAHGPRRLHIIIVGDG